jgi:hypothetical protein
MVGKIFSYQLRSKILGVAMQRLNLTIPKLINEFFVCLNLFYFSDKISTYPKSPAFSKGRPSNRNGAVVKVTR